ncbi:MAG: PilT/PilU family type 4a pilus ATPase [Candidatus Omnitrophota bacterium]|nr:PilT/PilU family type 4a pilus ATPase [Candidatus Omnitrophota bacterium]
MNINDALRLLLEKGASDLFYRVGANLYLRIYGKVTEIPDTRISVQDMEQTFSAIVSEQQKNFFQEHMDVDFAYYSHEFCNRFRVNIFMQRNTPSIVIRCIPNSIDTMESYNLPAAILKKLSLEQRGMVLLTGTMGSGKSTTIASMIEYINANCNKHILTIEEPIEFTFQDKSSIINQRELNQDVFSYPAALRAFTLQSPDVIYVGNIRDYETMSAAVTSAETGVLVLSTIHTVNAAQTIERIINFFPTHYHSLIRTQLSLLLKGVISLRLVPLKDGSGRIPAYEVMLLTPTISRLIREGKLWEINAYIEDGEIFGMQSFNQSLVKLVKEGKVSEEEAVNFSDSKDEFLLSLRGIKKGQR